MVDRQASHGMARESKWLAPLGAQKLTQVLISPLSMEAAVAAVETEAFANPDGLSATTTSFTV